jgi:hypothetical protein
MSPAARLTETLWDIGDIVKLRGMGDTGMSRTLTAALLVLTLCAPAFADTVPVGATVLPYQPTGAGKLDAVSCYEVVKTGTRTRNLQCARNSEWARLSASIASNTLGANLAPTAIPSTP